MNEEKKQFNKASEIKELKIKDTEEENKKEFGKNGVDDVDLFLEKTQRLNIFPFTIDYANKDVVIKPSAVGVRLDLDLNSSKGSAGSLIERYTTFTSTDATPSVKNANIFDTAGTTAITDFDDGVIGQVIYIRATASITITHSAAIQLEGATNFAMTNGDTLTLCMFTDQVWTEIGRSLVTSSAGIYGEIYVYDNSSETSISVQGTKVQFTYFKNNGQSNGTTPDHTNDHITIGTAGVYLINVSLSAKSTAGGGSDTFEFSVYKNNGGSQMTNIQSHKQLFGAGIGLGSVSLSGLASLSANDTVELWVTNDDSTDNIIIRDASLSLIKVS